MPLQKHGEQEWLTDQRSVPKTEDWIAPRPKLLTSARFEQELADRHPCQIQFWLNDWHVLACNLLDNKLCFTCIVWQFWQNMKYCLLKSPWRVFFFLTSQTFSDLCKKNKLITEQNVAAGQKRLLQWKIELSVIILPPSCAILAQACCQCCI